MDGLKPGGIKGEYDEYYGETPFWNDHDEDTTEIPVADCVDEDGKPILANLITDGLISAEVLLPQGEKPQLARILRRYVDENGQAIGAHSDNTLLSTLVYDAESLDGDVKKYAANLIAENLLS